MSFNSPLFFLFLFAVIFIHFVLSQKYRSAFLLFASFIFIGYYNLASLVTVISFSVFNYLIAKKIIGNRMLYVASLIINSIAIVLFNYFNLSNQDHYFHISSISFNVQSFVVALGLSFYSLQNIAYLTEVYFKRLQPETSISNYTLYNSFFPKIISGPILLPNEFIPQINKNAITKEKLIGGFHLILLGLVKKMVIADRLAPSVHSIFDYPDNYNGLTTLTGIYIFTIQLYFDFSGYTNMALGIAKMLGYDLKENFNMPLRSTSVSEFWRRWHISLISWFTNYIYYPVVYRLRKSKKIAALAGIFITFLISGIWHGIGFTFLAWASCHIIYLSFELLTKRFRLNLSERFNNSVYKTISVFIVFNAVCFSNIFFRSQSMDQALRLIQNIFSNFIPYNWLSEFIAPLAIGGHQMDQFNLMISLFIPIIVLLFERKINKIANQEKFNISFVVTSLLMILLFGIFASGSRFIYMQF